MQADELYEHLSYWQDAAKVDAYATALGEVITPGARVLDIGAGSGLLGLLAARAGAGEVWSYDYGNILGAARDIARENGLDDRIEYVKAFTTETDLPAADVVVCDQIGGLVFDAGVLEYFADAKKRSLRPDGVLVPSAFEIFLVPVQAAGPYEQVDGWRDQHGFLLSSMRQSAANSEFRVDQDDVEPLGEPIQIDARSSSDVSPISGKCSWTATSDGMLHGLSGWFNAQMSPSVRLTNNPNDPGRMNRWLNFYPVERPVVVEHGMQIEATIDIRPEARLVTWSLKAGDTPKQKMSTFNGQFLFDAHSVGGRKPANTTGERAALIAQLSKMAAAGTPLGDLVSVARDHGDLFATHGAAAAFARQVQSLTL